MIIHWQLVKTFPHVLGESLSMPERVKDSGYGKKWKEKTEFKGP